jgi:hypothetical protein
MVGEGSRFTQTVCVDGEDGEIGEGDRECIESFELAEEASGVGSLASAGSPRDSMSSTKDGKGAIIRQGGRQGEVSS